jgi:hypothetical protein
MASYTIDVTAGEYGAWLKSLATTVVDTVTFTDNAAHYGQMLVEIINHDQTAHLSVRADGTTPVSAAAGTILVPAGTVRVIDVRKLDPTQGATAVKLISNSAGSVTYSVSRAV